MRTRVHQINHITLQDLDHQTNSDAIMLQDRLSGVERHDHANGTWTPSLHRSYTAWLF